MIQVNKIKHQWTKGSRYPAFTSSSIQHSHYFDRSINEPDWIPAKNKNKNKSTQAQIE